jgi:type VI secretion system secreted protein VgrG
VLDSNMLARSVAGSKVVLDSNALMQGTAKATVQGASEGTVTAGAGTVKTSPSGVDASGPMINVSGSGAVSITGGVVKVNG